MKSDKRHRLILPFFNMVLGIGIGMTFGLLEGRALFWVLLMALPCLGWALLVEGLFAVLSVRVYRWRLLVVLLVEVPLLIVLMMAFFLAQKFHSAAPNDICCLTPADYGLTYEEVSIAAADGVVLHGWYLPSHNGAAIIGLHGWNQDRRQTMPRIAHLAEEGYGLLLMDLRGVGESTGEQGGRGWLDVRDIPYMIDYLETRSDVDAERIGIFGLSLGGQIALRSAAHDERLKGVVVEGASIATAKDNVPKTTLGGYFDHAMTVLFMQVMAWQLDIDVPSAVVEEIGKIAPRPILIISAESEAALHKRFFDAAQGNIEQWVVIGARHLRGIDVAPEEYKRKLSDFYARVLHS